MSRALADSNVLIASLIEGHVHHEPSVQAMNMAGWRFHISTHSLAETYSTLTRKASSRGYEWPSARAIVVLEGLMASNEVVGLTPAQTIDSIRVFAAAGGRGPLLYDWLIGRAAVQSGIDRIITWNVKDFQPLFLDMRVETPSDFVARTAPLPLNS